MAYPNRGAWLFRNVTRAFDFTPTLQSISINQELPDLTASLSCDVVDASSSLVFAVEDECRVTYDGERIWAGHLKTVTEDRVEETAARMWVLEGQDYTAKLSDAIVRRRRKRKREKARRRVRWLLNQLERRVWNLAGRDLSNIPDEYVEAYDYFGSTIDEGLAHVADELRLHYYIDLDNVFQMYRTEAVQAPFGLSNEAPNLATTFPFREWSFARDSVELANAVLVEPEKRKHSRWTKDNTSIAAYGRQERFVSDDNLHRPAQARNAGARTIATSKDPEIEGGLVCWEPGLWAGQTVHVREAKWDHDTTYFIRAVDIAAVDPHDEAGTAYLRTTVTLSDKPRRRLRGRQPGHRSPINKLARRRPGQTADVASYVIDAFNRTAVLDAPVAGSAAPLTWSGRHKMLWGQYANVYTTPTGPGQTDFVSVGAAFGPTLTSGLTQTSSWKAIETTGGAFNTPWTYTPSEFGCGIGGGSWSGWREQEWWLSGTVPAHPADMAGLRFSVTLSLNSGAAGKRTHVRVASSAPTAGRQGVIIATLAAGTHTVVIPGEYVPAEGETLWLGFGPADQADYDLTGLKPLGIPAACSVGYTGPNRGSYKMTADAPTSLTWMVESGTPLDFGNAASPAKAPWEGGWAWRLIGTEGTPDYGIDGDALWVSDGGIGVALFGEREDDDEPWGPWSDCSWCVELMVQSDSTAGGSIEVATIGEGEQPKGIIDFTGPLRVEGPTSSDEADANFTTAAWHVSFDTRSGKVRGKAWLASGLEPAAWAVECAMDETEDDSDRFVIWLRAEAGQTVRIPRIAARNDGRDGHRVVREWQGYTSGLTNRFTTRHPYREGSLLVRVSGVNVPPASEDGDEAEFGLSFYPRANAPLRTTYIIDQGTGD